MAVLDSSAAIDYLLGEGVSATVAALVEQQPGPSAPDVLLFEVLAVLRRHALKGAIADARAAAALHDLGDMPIAWFSSMPLRGTAWTLRASLGPADALFVALAAQLNEPIVTKDAGLAAAVRQLGVAEVEHLQDPEA